MKPYETCYFFTTNLNCFFRRISGCHHQMCVSKNSGFSPQIINSNRVFHYFHHPFWGTHIFGNIQIVMGFPGFPPNRRKEADWMPGLVLDLYGSVGVCGFDGRGAESFWRPRWPGQPKMGSKVWGVQGWLQKNILEIWWIPGYPNLILRYVFFAHHHF